MRFAAGLDIAAGNEVSYNELTWLSFFVLNNLNPPDLKSDVGGLWENWSATYPDCPVSLINRENMMGFVTG